MSKTRQPRALYLLDAFGLQNPWILWRIGQGKLDDTCPGCRGRGYVLSGADRSR